MPAPPAAAPTDTAEALPPRIVFGNAELQPRQRRLLVDGRPVALGARAFDLLLALVRRPDALRTKAELLDEVWPGLVVEEANLTVQVSTLRKLLGGDCIATIPGRGYRFTATVGLPADGQAQAAPAVTPSGTSTAPSTAPAPSPASAAPPGTAPGLPAPRALIGRAAELERLRTALAEPGCVTLTGPAGVGKTSLARALAHGHAAGAVWVDLAPLTDPTGVAPALARALGVPLPPPAEAAATLAGRIGGRLLLVDNAEHLVDAAAALVVGLLAASPALTVLVTSQQPLALAGERVQRLEPLAVPRDADAIDPDTGAAALFIARAKAAQHRFAPGPEALPLLHEICRRLDGMPLALEMAAARVPSLGLRGVRDALAGERFALLTTGYRDAAGRHRTLKSALDWSHGLLGADEQRLFRRLAVFSGGFSLDLVVAVAGEPAQDRWAVIDTLAALVDRSLVDADAGTAAQAQEPRYRLLETMRAYAAARLDEAGEAPTVHRRHAQALLQLFERAHADIGQRAHALQEFDNAREAAAWALRHDAALAVRLTTLICRAVTFVPWRAQAVAWLDACAAVVDDPVVDPLDRAHWWEGRARQHVMLGHPEAADHAAQALAQYRALDQPLGMFNAIQAMVRGTPTPRPDAQALCDELAALAARLDLPLAHMNLQGTLAHAARLRGDEEVALHHRRREHALALQYGYRLQAEAVETNIASALIRLGRPDEALAVARTLLQRPDTVESVNTAYAWQAVVTALTACGRHGEALVALTDALPVMRRCGLPLLADQLPAMLLQQGRPRSAALLLGQAEHEFETGAVRADAAALRAMDAARAPLRDQLGDELFEVLRARGRTLGVTGVDRLIEAALGGEADAGHGP